MDVIKDKQALLAPKDVNDQSLPLDHITCITLIGT